ncbi:MAG: LPS export ABC transporter periplasmic protein LptC [Ideonella sp.]|nr:LPS export ABC transporter periplasmic protein LptC [Ideonella sp.]MCC7457567.1 LPS export ABC transporter periplasmic protein LptC [Nitrospira sp.]
MNSAAAPPELHLPDLPEVEVSLGVPAAVRGSRGAPWRLRWRELLGAYLPLLLMVLLALGTWWLVKHTPRPPAPEDAVAPRSDPDYEMRNFAITRFAADGRVTVHIKGARLRHFPDTDRFEIDAAQIEALVPDGRVTRARAARALGNGDASEWQLSGGAHVRAQLRGGGTIELDSEFLQVFVPSERIRTHLPVRVRSGDDDLHAGGLEADNLTQQLRLEPPVRASFSPRSAARVGSKP